MTIERKFAASIACPVSPSPANIMISVSGEILFSSAASRMLANG